MIAAVLPRLLGVLAGSGFDQKEYSPYVRVLNLLTTESGTLYHFECSS